MASTSGEVSNILLTTLELLSSNGKVDDAFERRDATVTKKQQEEEAPIIIGAITIPVSFNPRLHSDEYGMFIPQGLEGPCIEYSCQQPPALKSMTLFHEALHALSDLNGIELTENQVSRLESLLPTVIVKNYQVFKAMFEALNDGEPLE